MGGDKNQVPGAAGQATAALALGLALLATPACADSIYFNASAGVDAVNINGTIYPSVIVDINASADTADIQYFQNGGAPVAPAACARTSAVDACGFRIRKLQSAYVSVYNSNHVGFYHADIDLAKSGLYVSVDRRNGGVGFGSSFGPTYPLAIYAYKTDTNPVDPYPSYALSSAVQIDGFTPYCPKEAGNGCWDGGYNVPTVGGGYFAIKYGAGNIPSGAFSSTAPSPSATGTTTPPAPGMQK